MGQIELLYQLQQIDDELREDKKQLELVVRSQNESKALIDARRRVEQTGNELTECMSRQKKLNFDLDGLNAKLKSSSDRLYSGLVKNPKELADLQHETESLDRRKSILEDQLLEAMILAEEAEDEKAEASSSLRLIQDTWEQQQANLREEQAALINRISQTASQREQHLGMVYPDFLRAYENAARRAGNLAVVALTNNRCRGCLVTVPANKVKAANEGKLVHCDSCSRIFCPI